MADEPKRPDYLKPVGDSPEADEPLSIAKPGEFNLDKFRSRTPENIAGISTLLTALPHHKISEARDFARLHQQEETHWSPELCFVNVPIQGMKRDTLHLIEEDLAMRFLSARRILRFRLALATKPYDVFFLCQVPSRNQDNSWNLSNLQACEQAKTRWVQVTSLKEKGIDSYKIDYARDFDAFPDPKWPKQSISELIAVTFHGRMITDEDHPGLLRLVGAKPSMS